MEYLKFDFHLLLICFQFEETRKMTESKLSATNETEIELQQIATPFVWALQFELTHLYSQGSSRVATTYVYDGKHVYVKEKQDTNWPSGSSTECSLWCLWWSRDLF